MREWTDDNIVCLCFHICTHMKYRRKARLSIEGKSLRCQHIIFLCLTSIHSKQHVLILGTLNDTGWRECRTKLASLLLQLGKDVAKGVYTVNIRLNVREGCYWWMIVSRCVFLQTFNVYVPFLTVWHPGTHASLLLRIFLRWPCEKLKRIDNVI